MSPYPICSKAEHASPVSAQDADYGCYWVAQMQALQRDNLDNVKLIMRSMERHLASGLLESFLEGWHGLEVLAS